ncbi:MAG: hypothetical protein WC047_04180 [Kiritimatiellales bacterium]
MNVKALFGCILLLSLSSVEAVDNLSILISSPKDEAKVDFRQEITGMVSDQNADVWVVIHPVETFDFWIQAPVTVKEDGSWKVVVYFGESGQHIGKKYEVRAFANPAVVISQGKSTQWPKAAARSNVLEVIRQ